MNHYLEIKQVERVGTDYFELWLNTGLGPQFLLGSHVLSRLERTAKEMATILAPNGADKLKIENHPKLAAMIPLVESYAHMRKA